MTVQTSLALIRTTVICALAALWFRLDLTGAGRAAADLRRLLPRPGPAGLAAISLAAFTLDGVRAAIIDGAALANVLPGVWRLLPGDTLPPGMYTFQLGEQYAKRTGRGADRGIHEMCRKV